MKAPIFHFNDIELSKVHETSLCLQVMCPWKRQVR